MKLRFPKKALSALAASALTCIFGGCTHDDTGTPGPVTPGRGNEVTITVNIPGAQAPSTRSIAGENGEAAVGTVDILVFEKAGGATVETLSEHVQGKSITPDESVSDVYKVQFRAKLTANPEATTVVVIANAADAVDGVVNAGGTEGAALGNDKQDILAALTFASSNAGGSYQWKATGSSDYTPIPMYGEYDVTRGGTNAAGLTNGMKMEDIDLIRMLARIDVVNNAAGFTLTDIYLVNYNTAGYVAPAWNTADGVILESGDTGYPYDTNENPALPADPGQQIDPGDGSAALAYHYTTLATAGGMLGEIYTYEALKTTGAEGTAGHSEAVCLIVKGKITGDNTGYYYRLDFTAGIDGSGNPLMIDTDSDGIPDALNPSFDPATVEYMPLYRNFRYRFTISGVTAPGYTGFGDALASLGIKSNLQVDLLVVDERGVKDFVFDNHHYLGVGDEVTFENYLGGETAEVPLLTNYFKGWQIDVSKGQGKDGIVYSDAGDTGWLSAAKDGASADRKANVKLTTLSQHPGDTDREAYIHFTAGNLRHKLRVIQKYFYLEAPYLAISGPAADYVHTGGSQTYSVESHITIQTNGGTTAGPAIPWTAEFSEDGGTTWSTTKPAWLTSFTTGGAGGSSARYTAVVEAFAGITASVEDELLVSSSPKGSAGTPYDLSTKGGKTSVNTANCYIINAPGHYKLPLVYGNAVKNGVTNAKAYSSSAAAASTVFLTQFVRHDDQPITGPYIYDQFTPADAVLVWMDAPNLIAHVGLTDSGQSLYFEVPEADIVQGNAIVAVRDAGEHIMWSWHIWVTPLVDAENPATDKVINYQGVTHHFMQHHLGMCTGLKTLYGTAPRSVQVRISQTGTDTPQTGIFTVTQNNGTGSLSDNNTPYWQWGRKDPMPPNDGSGREQEKTLYGNYSYTINRTAVSIGNVIQNPHTYYNMSKNWTSSGNHYNLWNADNTLLTLNDNTVIKTVYDPSPLGFTLPPPNVWSGFSITGNATNDIAEFNVSGPHDKGWTFYLYSRNQPGWEAAGTSFYPGVGYRESGQVRGIGNVYCWAAGPYYGSSGYSFAALPTNMFPAYAGSYREKCFPVRCVAE